MRICQIHWSTVGRFVALTLTVFISLVAEAKHQNWIEVRSAHFLVVTNAGEKQGLNTAGQLEQIRTYFRQSMAVAGRHPSRFVNILALKDESIMRELFPGAHLAGIFSHCLDQDFAIVDLSAQRSGHLAVFYHEYYHSITMPEFPDLPLWLAEGLADFYGHTDIGEDQVSTGLPDRDYVDLLRGTRPIPLDVLFKVDYTSPYYNEDDEKTSIFYAESWLLTHYLMLGNPEAHQRLVKYLEVLSQGKSSTEAIVAFGDLKRLQSELVTYLRQKKFLSVNAPLPKIDSSEQKIRVLPDAEADAYLGGFSVVLAHRAQGVEMLKKALRLDSNNSLANEYLGMAQFLNGEREKAFESASRAVNLDPNRASARYLRAYYATYGQGIFATDAPVEEDLRKAIALSPEFSPSYALLGAYIALRTSRLEEGLTLVKKALSFDPSNSTFQLSLARVLLRMDKYDAASAAASRANALARTPLEKSAVQEFDSYLELQKNKSSGTPQS